MVSIRRRKRVKRDVFIVDYRDGAGVRRYETCATRADADNVAAQKQLESGQAIGAPSLSAQITVKEYAERWLNQLKLTVRPSTREMYISYVTQHIVPTLGRIRLRKLTTDHIRALLAERLETKALAPGTVRLLRGIVSGMLTAAVDDRILQRNPAAGLGRKMRRVAQLEREQRKVKALTAEQLDAFLVTTQSQFPEFYPLFFVMARTGIRLGEARALEWHHVDLQGRELVIQQTLARGKHLDLDDRLHATKSNRDRRVDLSALACQMLEERKRATQEAQLAAGSSTLPRFVFETSRGPYTEQNIQLVFARILKAAKLPTHFSPHALRHSYAVHLLQRNTPITYVKDQLGHSSIAITVDTYGRWLPTGDKRYVDALDRTGEDEAQARQQAVNAASSSEPSGYRLVTKPEKPNRCSRNSLRRQGIRGRSRRRMLCWKYSNRAYKKIGIHRRVATCGPPSTSHSIEQRTPTNALF
ncbi:MAG: tyrosine-type recombinase/integrase [Bacteroidales bacterium]